MIKDENIRDGGVMMKKRIIALLLVAAVAAGVCAGCGKNETKEAKKGNKDASLTEVEDNGKLVVGLDPAFPPMGFTDEDQKIVGYDIDVAKEVCERIGVEPEFTPIDWETKEQELNTKGIDCIRNGFSKSPSRRRNFC